MIHRVHCGHLLCNHKKVFDSLSEWYGFGTDCLNIASYATCRAAQRLELKGVQAYNNVEGLQGLHTLPTAIVDYRGVRLSAQGLAPGLEGSEQDQEATPASR